MKFKLTIHPCFDSAKEAYTSELFETRCQLIAAKNACANLLLFLQDKLKAMDDETNIFICEEHVDGEWQDLELDDYE
jgi:hypothetical protein